MLLILHPELIDILSSHKLLHVCSTIPPPINSRPAIVIQTLESSIGQCALCAMHSIDQLSQRGEQRGKRSCRNTSYPYVLHDLCRCLDARSVKKPSHKTVVVQVQTRRTRRGYFVEESLHCRRGKVGFIQVLYSLPISSR